MVEAHGSAEHAYLTTTGRASRQPHTVELWYWDAGDRIWFLAGIDPPIVQGRPDWLRNLAADTQVTVRIGGQVSYGTAAVVGEPSAEADEARRRIAAKYMRWSPGDPLPRWQRDGVAVVVTPQ